MSLSGIIFLLGPSGAGKSQLAAWIEDDLNFLKIEVDESSPDGIGIDGAGLRPEWNMFHDKNIPGPIAKTLRDRISKDGFSGAVIALPSGNTFPAEHIQAAASEGMFILILYGSIEECRDAFLEREKQLKRGFDDPKRWDRDNLRSHSVFSRPEFSSIRISAFEKGVRRSRSELINDVQTHLASGVL